MADRALSYLRGQTPQALLTYDGLSDRLRAVEIPARADCPLCGLAPQILDLDESRYERGLAA